jgi:hypothetical protein
LAKPAKTTQFLSQIRFDVGRFGYLNRYVALREISQEALCHRNVPYNGFMSLALLAQLRCESPQVRFIRKIGQVLFE